jgi:hypothetical protein
VGKEIYQATGENPLVGTEFLIAAKDMKEGRGEGPYTGFIPGPKVQVVIVLQTTSSPPA